MLITNQHYEFKIFTYKLFASCTDIHDYGKFINVSQGSYVWGKLCLKVHLHTQNVSILRTLTIPHRPETFTFKHDL